MQGKLKGYENNPEILEELEEAGIDINQWLDYSETQYFSLESGKSTLAFSETISAPLNRIQETINSYAHTIKEVLKEYRPELSEFKVSLEDAKETEEKITKMLEELWKAEAEGNEKKAQGIEKGIIGLEKKLENIKTVSLWDKLLGDIAAWQQLKNDVIKAQDNLMENENKLQEALSGKLPSGKMIQELKEKANKAKEEMREKFDLLDTRIEGFKDRVQGMIDPALGAKRTEALIQGIELKVAEQFDHYKTDRTTIGNLFSEKSDKEKGKLENQPMSIFVWARNPDIDLYQGNYSPCCISIEQTGRPNEPDSTIADYNTDLGVQIVNIWNETKNEPVTAAWCWLGQDKNKEPAFVVDNIESNTLYSTNYPEQLTKELFDYLEKYAKSIGVNKIVLGGKINNDLPTVKQLFKMPNSKSTYKKIGGYNREDGYYLEAEDDRVKLIWEDKKSKKEKIKKKEEKKEIIKIEYTDVHLKQISKEDFNALKQIERVIYNDENLILGQAMVEDIKRGNGLQYSSIIRGKRKGSDKFEVMGYIVAVEDETDEGDPSIYLEDIAVVAEAQGQGIGWKMMSELIDKLKKKAEKDKEANSI